MSKLIYEKKGIIKLSESGIPSEKDPTVVSREILEGTKELTEITITENGEYDVLDNNKAKVNVSGGTPVSGEIDITENGTYDVATYATANVNVPSGPTPAPIAKGSVITLGGEEYRVLSANEGLTDCEVMHIGPAKISKFSNSSPSQDPSAGTTFIVNGEEKTGLKYEGSLLDQACEAFYDDLPAEVKAAIIEQEVVQDMYNVGIGDTEGDFYLDNTSDGGQVYRIKKVNDTPVTVGNRHAYALSCGALKSYYGGTSVRGLTVAKDFQLQSWFSDAYSDNARYACYLYYDYSGVSVGSSCYYYYYCVCPAFHIDLTKVSL